MSDLDKLLEEQLKDPEFKKEYDELIRSRDELDKIRLREKEK